eukprot:TRINITY_DN6830_c0_g1_i2.p1 TRINITY_DN6830_c0_g1~~TRINITY_DN6830_c0_g1_i2.p1  ORF type:complete len:235 (-),score=22.21 TRINITY_DN6830_c0_g1_i2:562-1230(-)
MGPQSQGRSPSIPEPINPHSEAKGPHSGSGPTVGRGRGGPHLSPDLMGLQSQGRSPSIPEPINPHSEAQGPSIDFKYGNGRVDLRYLSGSSGLDSKYNGRGRGRGRVDSQHPSGSSGSDSSGSHSGHESFPRYPNSSSDGDDSGSYYMGRGRGRGRGHGDHRGHGHGDDSGDQFQFQYESRHQSQEPMRFDTVPFRENLTWNGRVLSGSWIVFESWEMLLLL